MPETVKSLQKLAEEAEKTQRLARAAERELSAFLLAAMRALIPAGTVIDLRDSPRPDHLAGLTVVSGNGRGTKVFRIEKIRSVKADPLSIAHSTWTCDATPISMTTGGDMSGRTGKGRSTDTVTLSGSLGGERDFVDPVAEINRRVIATLQRVALKATGNKEEV